jgi:small subunit ribosomal protein S6
MREIPQHYELLFLVAGNIAENEQQPIIDAVATLLNDHKAVNLKSFSLGKRRLAFPIEKFKQGFYQGFEFDLLPNQLPKLESVLRLERKILRFLTIKKAILSETEAARQNKILTAGGQSRAPLANNKTKPAGGEKIKKIRPELVKIDSTNLDELNKKLDKILEDELVK